MALHHETFAGRALQRGLPHARRRPALRRRRARCPSIGPYRHTGAEQLAWIDANAPAYEHSTHSAALRGHASIYAMLARQAQGKVLVLQRKQQWNERPRFISSVRTRPNLRQRD